MADGRMFNIDTIPNLTMVHVAPWSDVWKAAQAYAKDKSRCAGRLPAYHNPPKRFFHTRN